MRIAPIAPGTRPELASAEAAIAAERGRVSPLYQVLLNSPAIAHGWEQLLTAVRNRSSLPADLRELVILRVAVLNRAPYEFDAHVPHAQKAGVRDEKIDALTTQARARGLHLPPDALEYLLARAPRDMRSLCSFLAALDRYSLEHKRAITLPVLREVLQNPPN